MTKRIWHKGPPPHVEMEELIRIFHYDDISGILSYRVSTAFRVRAGSIAGTMHSAGYLRVMVKGKNLYVHRVIWALTHGEWPDQIDHLNGVRHDNRICNLRAANNVMNCHNKHKIRATNTGVPNVYLDKRHSTYKASLSANGVFHHLGTFKTLQEATLAVDAGREKYQSPYYPKNARVPRIKP